MKSVYYAGVFRSAAVSLLLALATNSEMCGKDEYVGQVDGQLECLPCPLGATYDCDPFLPPDADESEGRKCRDSSEGQITTCELPAESVKLMDSGSCEWGWEHFQYKEDCEYGASVSLQQQQSQFSATIATVVDTDHEEAAHLPQGCWYKVATGNLYYNPTGDPYNELKNRRVICRLRKDLGIANAPDNAKFVKREDAPPFADIHTPVTDVYQCNPLFSYYDVDPAFDPTTTLVAADRDNLSAPDEFCVSETVLGLLDDYIYCILYLSGMSAEDVSTYVDLIKKPIALTLGVDPTQVVGMIQSTQSDGKVKLEFKVNIDSSEQARSVKEKEQDPFLNRYMETYISKELEKVGRTFSQLSANLEIHLIYQRSGVNPSFDRKRPDKFDVGDTVWVDFLYSGYFYPAQVQRKASSAQIGEFTVRFYNNKGEFSDYQEIMDHVTAEYVIDLPYFYTGDKVWALDLSTYTWRAATVTDGFGKASYGQPAAKLEYDEDVELINPTETLQGIQAPDDIRKWDFNEIRPMHDYAIFDRVWLEYNGEMKWHKGVITSVEGTGANARYTVYTDNGLVDSDVIGAYLHLINKARVLTTEPNDGNPWMTEADFRSLVPASCQCQQFGYLCCESEAAANQD